MESIDFFSTEFYHEPIRKDAFFGINDGVQEKKGNDKAYTTTDGDSESWNAIVSNPNNVCVIFTPLDHNIVLHPEKGETYSLCDGMLHSPHYSFLIFAELKIRKGDWLTKSIGQLKSTIQLFAQMHNLSDFKVRQAYAANKKHPNFPVSHKEDMQKFHNETKVRLRIQQEIRIPCQ